MVKHKSHLFGNDMKRRQGYQTTTGFLEIKNEKKIDAIGVSILNLGLSIKSK
jgi:hypothetical protein